jgi:predicted GH43/DUF377 family glycosyl hydrolase
MTRVLFISHYSLFICYGVCDTAIALATMKLAELLDFVGSGDRS